MINIEIKSDDKMVHRKGVIDIVGTKTQAVNEFTAVLDLLYRSDRLILAMAVKEFMEENFD